MLRIEAVLDLLEGVHQFGAEHHFVEFRAHDAVAMLAGMRALVFAHHGEGFLGDGAHGAHVLVEPQIEHRAHMQAADRGMRIPGAARAVSLEDLGEPRGVIGEMLERHRAVLDEGDRFALLLHRHHDVEAGGAHFGDAGLQFRIEHLDDAAPFGAAFVPGETEIADQLAEPFQAAQVLVPIVLGEFDEQDRFRIAAQEGIDGRLDIAMSRAKPSMVRSISSTAIGPSLTMCCAASIASWKLPKWQAPTARRPSSGDELQFDPGRERERAFRADQQMREIDVVAAGDQRVEIIAADAALHFRKAPRDLVGLARGDGEQVAHQSSRHIDTGLRRSGRNAHACRRPAPRRSRARCRAYCRSAASARRRNCCRPCRRWWRAMRSICRPETTGRRV